jgi:4-hydroxybutyryl-CoA dehydratase/vinylacetyl-CoA-Delta-isomerase
VVRTGEQYLAGLRDGRRVFYRGQLVEDVTRHPILRVPCAHSAFLFDLQFDRELSPPLAVPEGRAGEAVCSLYQAPASRDALLSRADLIEATTKRSGAVFNIVKVIGSDALFALKIVSAALDRAKGTDYAARVQAYHEKVSREDLATVVAQTDVKGDRSLRPQQQRDPDLYVRIKERRPDGIVVRGAKAHITQAPVSDEILVIPSRAMTEGAYAVAFAVPANAPGLTMICRPLLELEGARHPLEGPRVLHHALVEALVIFEDVFVPWERVFLAGEAEFAGPLAHMFALWHRYTAISYRAAQADLIAALGLEIAEANGVADRSHIRRDLVDLILFSQVQRMAARMAAFEHKVDGLTGICYPNPLYVNIGKLYSNTHYLSAIQALIDCAGGMAITAPSGDDFANPDLRPLIEKYLAGNPQVSGEKRFKLFLMLRELVGLLGGLESVTMVHAEGSIEASVIELLRNYDFAPSRALVERLVEGLS